MRIIEVEYLGPPAVGGVEILVEKISRHFLAAGNDVEIWCTDRLTFSERKFEAGTSEAAGLPVRRFASRLNRFWLLDPHHLTWQSLHTAYAAEAKRNALFHIHSFPSTQAWEALVLPGKGSPVVITPHHDIESLRRYAKLTRGRFFLSAMRRIARRYPHFALAVHTDIARDFWVNEVGWPAGQIAVIPNGVDLAEFDAVQPEDIATAIKRWPAGEIRILFVGRLAQSKGIDLLLQALARVNDASLLLVGPDGGAKQMLVDLAQHLAMQNRVNFVELSRREVCAAFRACDLFVLPSRYGENFGIVAIEAMAAGKPVIASDCGGLPTLVKTDENGMLFHSESVDELAAAIEKLAASQELREQLGNAGRRMVEARYTWERVGEEYLQFFASLYEKYNSPIPHAR